MSMCLPHAEIRYVRGRFKFNSVGNSATFPSVIVIFRPTSQNGSLLQHPLNAWLWRRFTPFAVSSQSPRQALHLLLKFRVVTFPFGKIRGKAASDFISLPILPREQLAIDV